ncbi:hypothetical protein PMAYCL1PPCAC_00103 [Pristionchus mayeri]|uniref:WD40 domain-containing protein n=1 Tax=Pristionchus mayeri TaxID=1317129 RepID=A0AAN4Z0W5_9BILA|nr:hypothetical protein PMAYCL1PPCAC_00103 [Pristionchus mayeri]
MSSCSLLQLPRLSVWITADGRVISGCGPHLEVYSSKINGDYSMLSRTSIFASCGRPVTGVWKMSDSDYFVVIGSSLLCVLKETELNLPVVPSSRIYSFTDEIVTVAYTSCKEISSVQYLFELGLILRSGRTICVTASIDDTNRLRVDIIAEYDCADSGLLMSALCLTPAQSTTPWENLRCIAGSAMGEVRLWGTTNGQRSSSTLACGKIGFVISMAVVDECDERGVATVVAVTENRAVNLWRICYMKSNWLQLLQKEEAAHLVRPSAIVCCRRTRRAVSAAEDGELCVWAIAETRFSLLRRFQTRVGSVRSLAIDEQERVIYGSMTGSLFSLPISSLIDSPKIEFIKGLQKEFKDSDRPSIRSFAVVHRHQERPDERSILQTTRQAIFQCLGEDGSIFEVSGDTVSERFENEGSYLHLHSWTDIDCAITVVHDEKKLRMNSYLPPSVSTSTSVCTVLSESSIKCTILTARPTMSRSEERGTQPFVVVQSTDGGIALISHCFGEVRFWRYRIPCLNERAKEDNGGFGKKRRQNHTLIVNTVAIDRSTKTAWHVILGTTNGRLMYAPMRGDGEMVPDCENVLDFALDVQRSSESLNMCPRSHRFEKTSISQLEYCYEREECTALTKNGWLIRLRVEVDKGLVVCEEEISRELGVEWPVKIERIGGEEYVVGFNERNLVVVSRRLKTCLLSIDCGGGHRQVSIDLEASKGGSNSRTSRGYGSKDVDIERITVYYGKHQGIVSHSQQPLTFGLRQLAWTPHRDKIVFCTSIDRYVLTGSIDGEIVLGAKDLDSLSVLRRWYIPETTKACIAERGENSNSLRFVFGGPKGDLYMTEWCEQDRCCSSLIPIPTANDSRIIDIHAIGDYVVAAFADAKIAVFHLDSNLCARIIAVWKMPIAYRSTFAKVIYKNEKLRISRVPLLIGDGNCISQIDAHFSKLIDGRILVDGITSGGTLIRLAFDVVEGLVDHVWNVPIDRSALTEIRRDSAEGIMVISSDSGTVFMYNDSDESHFELLSALPHAHVCQITGLTVFRSAGALRVASVSMDCSVSVMEMHLSDRKFSLVGRCVIAVNDPSSIQIMSEAGILKAIVAGCGLDVVEL